MMIRRIATTCGLLAISAAAAQAQAIPEISARCGAQNAQLSAVIQQQCLPLGSVAAKLACGRRVRSELHADGPCLAETRRHLVAVNHACLAGTAPQILERAGVCKVVREHPTAYAH